MMFCLVLRIAILFRLLEEEVGGTIASSLLLITDHSCCVQCRFRCQQPFQVSLSEDNL